MSVIKFCQCNKEINVHDYYDEIIGYIRCNDCNLPKENC